MLDKSPRKMNVSKLRSILLLKADFNALHKIMHNQRILLALEKNNHIPMEIVGARKVQAPIHVAINKKLIAYISNQVKNLSVVISNDATNCNDRAAHTFSSLTAHHFSVHIH